MAVGTFVTVGALAARAARVADPISSAYLERSLPEGNGRNVVNVILTDFRALDTFGEIAVVATAAIGIAGLTAGMLKRRGERDMNRRSIILERAAALLVPPILVVALYLLFVGHNAPGGGFVGGLTAGLAIALAAAAEGLPGIRRTTRVAPTTLLGVGLVIAGITGAGGWVLGQGFLDAGARTIDLPDPR